MTESIFCKECGIEILSELDLGYPDTEIEMRSIFPGHPQKDRIVKCFHVCASCKDEEGQRWEDFKKTPEYQYECSFMRFVRQFEADACLKKVNA